MNTRYIAKLIGVSDGPELVSHINTLLDIWKRAFISVLAIPSGGVENSIAIADKAVQMLHGRQAGADDFGWHLKIRDESGIGHLVLAGPDGTEYNPRDPLPPEVPGKPGIDAQTFVFFRRDRFDQKLATNFCYPGGKL
jgi:hypothetical protein